MNPSHFTFPTITPGCQAGPRACRSYSLNAGCGQKRGYLHSAKISSAPLVAQTAAASASPFFNLTSQSNVHSSRSSLRGVATCVISIPSTTANSISLSSIGEQQRPNTVCFPSEDSSQYGEDHQGVPRQCSPHSDPTVCLHLSFFILSHHPAHFLS